MDNLIIYEESSPLQFVHYVGRHDFYSWLIILSFQEIHRDIIIWHPLEFQMEHTWGIGDGGIASIG